MTGTVTTVTEGVPEWRRLLSVTVADDGGLRVEASASDNSVGITIAAPIDAATATTEVAVRVTGCRVDPGVLDCPDWERQDKTIRVAVDVVEPGATIPTRFLDVDPTRWELDADGQKVLPGELMIYAHLDSPPADVVSVINNAGGALTGAWTEFGYYQARFADTAAGAAAISASPLIETTTDVFGVDSTVDAEPVDWNGRGEDMKWTFRQTQAVDAWNADSETSTGSPDVQLGIVDYGIFPNHVDLRGVLSDYHVAGGDHLRGKAWMAQTHGTHVAGTMCSTDQTGGLVGVSQECTLHGFDLAALDTTTPQERMRLVDEWLSTRRNIRVVNMSLSFAGANSYSNNCRKTVVPEDVTRSDRLFAKYADTLFVVAAGNCGNGGSNGESSYRSVQNSIPAANDSRTNVLSVAATSSKQPGSTPGTWEEKSPLASYSATDAEIAAPGGESPKPGEPTHLVWSSLQSCSERRVGIALERTCTSTEGPNVGTSMAAPFVSGTAGLMLAANPDMTANELAVCLQTEGNPTEVYDPNPKQPIKFGLRELNVKAAVDCAKGLLGVDYAWTQIPDDATPSTSFAAPDGSHVVTFYAGNSSPDWWIARIGPDSARPFQGLHLNGSVSDVTIGPDSTAYVIVTDPESSGSDIVAVDFDSRQTRSVHRYDETIPVFPGGRVIGRSIEYIDDHLFIEALAPNALFSCHTRLDKINLDGVRVATSPNSSDCGAFWQGTAAGLSSIASVWDTAAISLFDPSDLTKSTYGEYNGSFYSPAGGPDGRWAMYAGVNWWANNCGRLIELNHTGQLRSIPGADLVPEGSSCSFQSFALDDAGNTAVAIGHTYGTFLLRLDAAGNVTTIDDLGPSIQNIQLAYDDSNRLVVVYRETNDCTHPDGQATCATLAVRTYDGTEVQSIRAVGGAIGNSYRSISNWSIADGSVLITSTKADCISGPSNCWDSGEPGLDVFELPVDRQSWHDPATTQ